MVHLSPKGIGQRWQGLWNLLALAGVPARADSCTLLKPIQPPIAGCERAGACSTQRLVNFQSFFLQVGSLDRSSTHISQYDNGVQYDN